MTSTPAPDPQTLSGQIRDWALEAGRLLLEGLDTAHDIDAKTGTEFVTEMDRAAEELLLARIGAAWPADRIAAEESGVHEGGSGRTWYVDPLDGTTNYAHGYPIWAVSIACAEGDEVVAAGVYAPYLDELYLAVRGDGAVLERPGHGVRRPLVRREERELTRSLLATGFPYRRDAVVDRNARLAAAFLRARCHGVRRGGSAAVDLCHVASGKLDGYWEFRLRPWDTAAGTLVAREAGALVTGFEGERLPIHTKHIVAAAPGLHGHMLRILAEVEGEFAATWKGEGP